MKWYLYCFFTICNKCYKYDDIVTRAEGAETAEATPAYGATDITEGLERSTLEDSLNESRADTTGDITQDSIRDVA